MNNPQVPFAFDGGVPLNVDKLGYVVPALNVTTGGFGVDAVVVNVILLPGVVFGLKLPEE